MNIEIVESEEESEDVFHAEDIEHGQLFRDSDGDLHYRIDGGSLMLSEDEIEVFSSRHFNESGNEFFGDCTLVKGTVSMKVELE